MGPWGHPPRSLRGAIGALGDTAYEDGSPWRPGPKAQRPNGPLGVRGDTHQGETDRKKNGYPFTTFTDLSDFLGIYTESLVR